MEVLLFLFLMLAYWLIIRRILILNRQKTSKAADEDKPDNTEASN
jgi:hypothetical protein